MARYTPGNTVHLSSGWGQEEEGEFKIRAQDTHETPIHGGKENHSNDANLVWGRFYRPAVSSRFAVSAFNFLQKRPYPLAATSASKTLLKSVWCPAPYVAPTDWLSVLGNNWFNYWVWVCVFVQAQLLLTSLSFTHWVIPLQSQEPNFYLLFQVCLILVYLQDN